MMVASKACSICMLAHHRIDVMPNMIMIGYLVSRYRDPDHIIASGNCCSQLMMMWDVLPTILYNCQGRQTSRCSGCTCTHSFSAPSQICTYKCTYFSAPPRSCIYTCTHAIYSSWAPVYTFFFLCLGYETLIQQGKHCTSYCESGLLNPSGNRNTKA